jgi:orotidine-5'-phosphate decarboxylase
MPKSIFLVPGYGAQGGQADDVVPCFNRDGLGALVNSSRGIMCAYQEKFSPQTCSKADFKLAVKNAAAKMRIDLIEALKKHHLEL